MESKHIVDVEFECVGFPSPLPAAIAEHRLGIQDKQEVKQDVPLTVYSARFKFSMNVVVSPTSVIYSGSHVQGSRDERFIYISHGEWIDSVWKIHSRIKVPLKLIERKLILAAIQDHKPLHARIQMTNSKGQLAMASLKSDQVQWFL